MEGQIQKMTLWTEPTYIAEAEGNSDCDQLNANFLKVLEKPNELAFKDPELEESARGSREGTFRH